MNIYIVYSLDPISNTRNTDFTAQNCLFGAVKLTKNTDTSNYKYVGCGICFDEGSKFGIGNITNGKNIIILGCDASSSSHANNKKNNIIALGKNFIEGLTTTGTGNTTYSEKIYKTNMTEPNKKDVLSLYCNENNSYLFANGVNELQFKAQSFTNNMKSQVFCIGNISNDWSLTNSTKTSLYGNVYDFAIDYEPLSGVKTIYDIHRYLMKKHNIENV